MTLIPINFFKRFARKTFLFFSFVFFLIISLVAIAAYMISARQINRSFVEQQLANASETTRLRLATIVNEELALVLKMADTPVIRKYFINPYDSELEDLALVEFNSYQQHFKRKLCFWISDENRIFYTTGNEPYILNPDDPDSYWYNLTLYRTGKYNFNINYNPTLQQINLWVNVPVFTEENGRKKPVGMLGTAIDLTEFSNFIVNSYNDFDINITPYIFNKYFEITSASDYDLVFNKTRLDAHLGKTGIELINAAQTLSDGESVSFVYDNKIFLVSSIPAMEWYLAVSYPMPGFFALNQSLNTVFFSMLFLILFMLIVINIFIASSENAIEKQNMELIEANKKIEIASRAKTDFLAKMSHEIRTPMNAITGMAELLFRYELSNEARNYVKDIKQAGNNLISIINDILDLSKIESGKLEIIPANYLLASLVNDTVNIIRTRIRDKPIRFFTNIDGNIPHSLIGDEVRMRQIFINLLSNAAKYTSKGFISLSITIEPKPDTQEEEDQIRLKISVADSGVGVKPEDQEKLFGDFVRVDRKNNDNTEGTGLGLSIAKRLCVAMGGSISMESEYGKGSVFTAVIPQGVLLSVPFAAVVDAAKKKVLVYEGRKVYARSLCWSLENMNVPYIMSNDLNDFSDALLREDWYYVFSGYGLYERIKPIIEKLPEGKRPPLALLTEWGTEAYIPNVRFVSIPVPSLSIANVLNGQPDAKDYNESYGVTRFTFSRARIMVVDDIPTNLKVAEGLLESYKVTVDSCLGGEEAIEVLKNNHYDLVFMDHMMPGMDGIEAAAIIREWEARQNGRQIPIVALTANAVVGMREMFIEKGFSDFLSKPIDISKLDDILNRWLPVEKRDVKAEEKNKLIILADNSPENLKEGKKIISQKYRVATAPSAEKLLSILETNTPALLLLDKEMMEKDGYEAVTAIRTNPLTREIPFVFFAGKIETDDAEKCRSLGAADCILKPFDPAILFACIDKAGR